MVMMIGVVDCDVGDGGCGGGYWMMVMAVGQWMGDDSVFRMSKTTNLSETSRKLFNSFSQYFRSPFKSCEDIS